MDSHPFSDFIRSEGESPPLPSTGTGSPVAPSCAWVAPPHSPYAGRIAEHLAHWWGPSACVLRDSPEEPIPVDVHVVLPGEEDPTLRLCTTGMSDRPMPQAPTPEQARVELTLTLPAGMTQALIAGHPQGLWPVELLRYLAKYPHRTGSWLWAAHSMRLGLPPFAGAMLLPHVRLPQQEFGSIEIPGQPPIQLLAIVPLYEEELKMTMERGLQRLLDRFDARGINELVDGSRRNVAHSRWSAVRRRMFE